jgi:hypothetical protein
VTAELLSEHFNENCKESGDNVASGMQLETENTEIEDPSLAAGWQPHVDPEQLQGGVWSDTTTDSPPGRF